MIVVDASVAVKWLVPEEDSDKAEQFLFSPEKLVAPTIIRIEVAAALTRLARMKTLSLDIVSTLLEDWQHSLHEGTVTLEPTQRDFEAATRLSLKIEHQLQDCLYLAVAKRLKVPLVTADQKFLKKVASTDDNVRSL